MASGHKGDGDVTTEQDDSSSANEEYFHNPEDFIDIHANEKSTKCIDNERLHQADLENVQCSSAKNCSWSLDKSELDSSVKFSHDLKTPVQVSEDSDTFSNIEETIEKKLHVEGSDEEYHSAEDRDKESCSDDEFIPLKEEENDKYDESFIGAEGKNECENDNSCSDSEKDAKESEIINELEIRKKAEELLTEEEKLERKNRSQLFKDEGNNKFRSGLYDEASADYTEALNICPLVFHKERAIMFANRAACYMKKELYSEAIKDSTEAVELHPYYLKAILRRAELYEKTEKLDEALQDYQKVLELDPSQHMARAACVKLSEQIKDRNEKLKEEMIGKLKDLGNLVLRPFGLSVNNFNIQQDPNTGSYSVQFQQRPPNNGH